MLKLVSAFNAQGSRVVQIRAVKIYVAAVEALMKKERGYQNSKQDETQFNEPF
jgi:hypothetical protein